MAPAPQPGMSWRRRAHLVIDRGAGDDLSVRLVHGGLVALIVVNIAALVLESVPSLAAAHGRAFYWIGSSRPCCSRSNMRSGSGSHRSMPPIAT